MKTVTAVMIIVVAICCISVRLGMDIGNKADEIEIQYLKRQLTELRLNCNNQEITEVLSQLISPLAIDELRALAEKLRQQKLRLIKKQREEEPTNER